MPYFMNADALRELRAYRSTGMTPESIKQMRIDCEIVPEPLPVGLPNDDDLKDYKIANDDELNRCLNGGQWEK